MVDEKTGRVVEGDNKARGYELKRGRYVEIEPEELEAVEVESTRAIDIDKFVPEEEIDKRYYERPYYIAPDDKSGEEAFAVIRDAMKDKGRVAVARIVFANREHILLRSNPGARECSARPSATTTRSVTRRSFSRAYQDLA
jgi:Ku protein